MDYKKIIEERINNLNEIYNKYEQLVKNKSEYIYRLNAIGDEIVSLENILKGNTSVNDWEQCFYEDSKIQI